MNGRRPENFDYPMSQFYRRGKIETRVTKSKQEPKPETIHVAGMTLHNIDPDSPPDEKTFPKVEDNLKTMGILPLAPPNPLEGKTDFLNLVPEIPTKGNHLEKAIDRANRILNDKSIQGEIDRAKLLGPDARQDAKRRTQHIRKNMGLPPKRLSFKERLHRITSEEATLLKQNGYQVDGIPINTYRHERLLLALKELQKT